MSEREHVEVNGVTNWQQSNEAAAVVLESEAAARVSAALLAIRTCADLLNDREVRMGAEELALCDLTAQGLLAAISCAAELVGIHVNGRKPEGVIRLHGKAADDVVTAAWKRRGPAPA